MAKKVETRSRSLNKKVTDSKTHADISKFGTEDGSILRNESGDKGEGKDGSECGSESGTNVEAKKVALKGEANNSGMRKRRRKSKVKKRRPKSKHARNLCLNVPSQSKTKQSQ